MAGKPVSATLVKMTSTHTRMCQRGGSNNFEDEYIKTLEDRFCLKVQHKPEHDALPGDVLQKMKVWKSEGNESPKKSDKNFPQKDKVSHGRNFPPNGTHFTYEKAKLKALSQKRIGKKQDSNGPTASKQKKRNLKRKFTDDGNTVTRPKRRKLNSLLEKQDIHLDNVSNKKDVLDAREIILARRAGRQENERMSSRKDLLEIKEEKTRNREKMKLNNIESLSPSFDGYDSDNSSNNSTIRVVDQNLNHITDCINRENLKDMYTKKLQDVSDLSPFKGQMSAFEISLLKGKQNLERRKSIESATLRSSPRMNANVPKPDYREKKRIKSRVSLASTLDLQDEKINKKTKKISKRFHKRRRTVDVVDSLSPGSVENKITKPVPKQRKSKGNERCSLNSETKKAIRYRLNGSAKLKTIPTRLSLDSLSGTSDQHQGSAFTSLNKPFTANNISGTTAALKSLPYVNSDSKSTSLFNKPLERPNTLSFDKDESDSPKKHGHSPDHCFTKATETARNRNEKMTKVRSKKSLEETVNMLRRNTSAKCNKESSQGKLSLTPRSESRTSRRSSRSSTPNMSPIKSEILTPNSTPCSSPSKSPCSTPVGSKTKLKKCNKKKYLFSRNDEVLARWHDGLYYLGNILRIEERSKKCLLRYEDDSQYWSLFKDIHRVLKEEEMICSVCLSDVSEPPNEIVLCEYCLQGYHQQCHSPNIGSGKIVDPDEPWYCRKCMFFLQASGTGKATKEIQWDEEMKKVKLTLPYNLDTLTWDQQHKNNVEATYCYCGGPGIWFQKMLQCCRCKQWYHEACMQCLDYQLLYADSFYIFVCSPCNAGNEYIKRLDVDWADLVHIGLFNLAVMQRRKYFDLNSEIMPWLLENWDQLQVNKFSDLSDEDKEKEVCNALEFNKTRFVNGTELRKKSALWGLRVRVPPPRIHITLPFTGLVTDQLMNKLKIKGRRSKVFMPVECKSPVNQLHHSPLHGRYAVKKRLDAEALGLEGAKYFPSKQAMSPQKPGRKQKKLPFLESLIPFDDSFTGCNHPFKTEIEQSCEKAEQDLRAKIWNKFLSTFDCNDEIESNIGVSDCVQDDPPILEKVEPVVPTVSCNGTPPMPEIQEKKPGKRSVPKLEKTNAKRTNERKRRRKSVQRTNVHVHSVNESEKEDDFIVKHVKSVAGGNYYCCHDKTGYGRGFSVMGKRADKWGRVEYMVKWD